METAAMEDKMETATLEVVEVTEVIGAEATLMASTAAEAEAGEGMEVSAGVPGEVTEVWEARETGWVTEGVTLLP